MKAKAVLVTARPPSPFAYESVASGRGLGEHQRVRESVQKRIIHTRRFFLGFFPGPQTEGAVPSSAQKAVSLALWKAKRPRGHRRERGEDGTRLTDRGAEEGRALERPKEK